MLDGSIGDFVPHVWNDQVGYWHYVASFKEHGFDTGYYTANEHPAAVGFIHYDVHGPVFQMLYGTVAKLAGWDLETGIYFNMAVVAAGVVVFCLAAGLDRRQVALAGAVVLLSGPVLLYLPTTSQEPLQQAIAMALAAVACLLLAGDRPVSRGALVAMLALVAAVSLIRFSWALLALPLLLLATARWTRGSLFRIVGVSVVLGALVLLVFSSISAPGGNAPLAVLADLPSRPWATTRELFGDAWRNLGDFFGNGIVGLQAIQIVALIAVAAVMVRRAWGTPAAREWLFHVFNLGAIVVAGLFLYLPEGYHRVMGAHLLLSLLVMVRFRHFALVAGVALTNVLLVGSFVDSYRLWEPNFRIDREGVARQRQQLARHIRYEEGAPSAWCNTVLLPVEMYDARVTLVPAGMGISYALLDSDDPLRAPVKSRYILLGEGRSGIDPIVRRERLEPVATLPSGRLYENPAARCA